ncbi:hypothetical protein Paride_0400 [Pseudomonas phage Paride]|nr:hypothetical protein Paride_0400 [Pseudomonas phage Paride]
MQPFSKLLQMSIKPGVFGEILLQHVGINATGNRHFFDVHPANVQIFDIVQIRRGQGDFHAIDFIFGEVGRQFELQPLAGIGADEILSPSHCDEFIAAQLLQDDLADGFHLLALRGCFVVL